MGALSLLACATPLSTFQTAAVPPTGHYSAAIGWEGSLAIGPLVNAIDTGYDVGKKVANGQPLTTQEKLDAFDAGMQLLLNPPSFGYNMSFAYVPWRRLELSLRYTVSTVRVGTRYQILDRETGPFDMSVGLGLGRYVFEIPFGDKLEYVKVDDFTRWQIDVPVLIGTQNRWFRVWGGPRFVATFFDTAMRLDLKVEDPVFASMSGQAYYVGGQGGLGFGYRWIFVAFELTIAEMIGRASFDAPMLAEAPHRDEDLSALVIYPSFGLMGEW